MTDRERSTGQSRLIQEVVEQGICVQCGACVGLCPYFDYYDGRVVVQDQCHADTWRCLQMCPRADYEGTTPVRDSDASGDYKALGPYRSLMAARSTDGEIRERAQYGGAVSAMLIYGLEKGTIGSAVLTDSNGGLSPAGKIARNRSEVLACAGSRYSASAGLAALNRTLKTGETRLAVVGLPCQMEALARMEASEPDGKERSQGIALRIGLFCTWALDYRHLDAFLKAKGVSDHVTKYDIPPPPAEVFQVDTGQGMKEFPLSDVRELVQKGCALCEDMTAEWADVSVGTVEGQTRWNTLIVRTDAGEELVRELMKSGHLETNELPPENLEHLNEAAANKRQRAIQAKRDRAGSQP